MRTDRVRGRLDGHRQAPNAAERALTSCVLAAALADHDVGLRRRDWDAGVGFGAGVIFRSPTFDRRRKEVARAGHLDAVPALAELPGDQVAEAPRSGERPVGKECAPPAAS